MTLNELDLLKQKADLMGISYKSNIGVEALKAKINAKLDGNPDPDEGSGEGSADGESDGEQAGTKAQAHAAGPRKKTKAEIEQDTRDAMQKDQMALVRVRISCLNPLKASIKGEIITVANKYLGTVRKFVPFGEATDNGYHLPRVLLNELKARKFNSVTTKKGPNGQLLPSQRLVPEFAIEELEPLTQAELDKLASAQLAAEGG